MRPSLGTELTPFQQAIGGTIWHGIKGFRNSPYGERRIGAITAVKMRAPVLGGNFGAWGGIFSLADCAVKGIRQKEDPWNAIGAGFLTGGALAIRGGFKSARNGAIGCAVLLAVIEGVGIGFQKMMAGSTKLEVSRPWLLWASFEIEFVLTYIPTGPHATPITKRRASTSIIGSRVQPTSSLVTLYNHQPGFGVENLPTSEEYKI